MWYDPTNKDTLGRRGPAQVATVNDGEANITVRCQGRTFDRRHQEARVHIFYVIYLLPSVPHKQHQWGIAQKDVQRLTASFATVGVVLQRSAWHLTPGSSIHDGRRFSDVALSVASHVLHANYAATTRGCRVAVTMPALKGYSYGEVLMWRRGANADSAIQFAPRGVDLTRPFPAKLLAFEGAEVDSGEVAWAELCLL